MDKLKQRRDFLKQISLITAGLVGVPLFNSCSNYIDFTPYQIKVNAQLNQTNKNIDKLSSLSSGGFKPFKIALISDTHTYYDNFVRAVDSINKQKDIDFVIHCGDITLSAVSKEFEWFSDIVNKINVPVLTVIGNHDYLSNGVSVYERVFGKLNYTFVFNNCKFVMFDDVFWERNLNEPDFKWLEKNLVNDKNYKHVIPVSHIPPWGDQYTKGSEFYFNNIMERNNIKLSIHGHTHSFLYDKVYNGLDYLTVNDIDDRQYVILDVTENNLNVNIVKF